MRIPRAAKIAISACLAIVPAAAATFYPGVPESQSDRAHDALRAFHNGDLPQALKLLREMDAEEERGGLPPLSRLLQTAMATLYLERDDAEDAKAAARLRALADSASARGLARCAARAKDNDPTCRLIEGGILGFRALLRLNSAPPLAVLDDGLDAVAKLEAALALDGSVRDAHMGLGLFHVIGASASPRAGRAILRAAGRSPNLDSGLAHLRRSGYEGQYTTSASQFYLIRFLSPYDEELVREKEEIFRALREAYPLSPLPLFLRTHESLSFRPEAFDDPRARAALARGIRSVRARDQAGARYLNLAKWQYALLDPVAPRDLAPDTAFDLGGYAFYPAFLEALRLRREILDSIAPDPESDPRLRRLASLRKAALAKLRGTSLNPRNREYYAWQIRDALDPKVFLKSKKR